jgi:hypothetical protein
MYSIKNVKDFPKPTFSFDENDPNLTYDDKLHIYKINRAYNRIINSKDDCEVNCNIYNYHCVENGNSLKYPDKMVFSLYADKKYDFLITLLENDPDRLKKEYYTPNILLHLYQLGLPIDVIKFSYNYKGFIKVYTVFIKQLKNELNKYFINNITQLILEYAYDNHPNK